MKELLSSSKQSSVLIAPVPISQIRKLRSGGTDDLPGSEQQSKRRFSSSSCFIIVPHSLPTDRRSTNREQTALGLGEPPGAKSWNLGGCLRRGMAVRLSPRSHTCARSSSAPERTCAVLRAARPGAEVCHLPPGADHLPPACVFLVNDG